MKKTYHKLTFMVTETCQNGNERRIKKSVLSEPFENGRFIPDQVRIQRCIETLKAEHYYRIEYIGTEITHLLIMD